MSDEPMIYVLDDDEAVRRALTSAGKLLGYTVRAYQSAAEFLEEFDPSQLACLVLDIKMPRMTGLQLQKLLADRGHTIPIVMISGHADVRTAVEAMTLGAVTLLEKPFRLEDLHMYLRKALEKDRMQRVSRERLAESDARLAQLTPKEREVLELISAGRTNREMAEILGLSVRAVEDRRARLMKKAGANTVADLVRLLTTHQLQ